MVDEESPSVSLKSIFLPPVRISVDSPISCSSKKEHLLMTPESAQSAASFSVAFDSLQQQDASLRRRLTAEVGRLTKLSVPLFIQNLLAYSTTIVAVAFVGHLNRPELLSSAVLANSLFNVTGYSLLQGLASGMESLCGQAYGARSYKTLGLVLQRALLICWAICIPISLLWTHSEKLLLLLGQKPSIAAGAALYLRVIMPTLYTGAVVECLKRYLLAQRVVLPGMVVTVATCLLSPIYNWLFIFKLQLGLQGAALAFTCSQGTTALLLVLYTIGREVRMAAAGDETATWCTPSMAVFAGWGAYLSYGLPATIQLCTEWWMYEVVIFMAGMAPNAEIGQGVMGLLFQLSALSYMSALAYGSSVNTRVGNELGAGNAAAARLSVYTCVVIVALVQSLIAVACRLADKPVVGILTNNEEVQRLTIDAMPILLPTFVFDALNAVAQGILRGAGRPGIGAVLNSAGYWGLGVPLASYFGLYLGWSVRGFWAALLTTSAFMSVVQFAVIFKFDWQREVDRAAEMMSQHEDQAADIKAADLGGTVGGPVLVRAISSAGSLGGLGVQGGGEDERCSVGESMGSIGEESDTAPLLDGGRLNGIAAATAGVGKQLGGQRGRGIEQQAAAQLPMPSRLSRMSLGGQQEQQQEQQQSPLQQGGSAGGDAARSWFAWPRQQGARAASSGTQQGSLQEQTSLTRELLRSSSSVDGS